MTPTKQAPVDHFDVRIKMLRNRISGAQLAKRHHVSKMTVSRAVNGDKSAAWLLPKLGNSCDVISSQRMRNASRRLRSISDRGPKGL